MKYLFTTILALVSLAAFAGQNTVQQNVMTTNTAPPFYTSTAFKGTTLWVSPMGDNTRGKRGGASFANLWAAGQAAQDGDHIYVQDGRYQEGSNIVGKIASNVSIEGLGHPVIVYTNYSTTIGPLSIYIQPSDNLFMRNITFSTPVSNSFSAWVGGNGNVAGTATNLLFINVGSETADSDGWYWGATNWVTATFIDCIEHHYWDGWAYGVNINTNDLFSLKNCDFHCDITNGINPSTISGMNMAVGGVNGGCVTLLDNVGIFISKTNTGASIGIRIGSVKVNLNRVTFYDAPSHGIGAPNFADISYGQDPVFGGGIGSVNSGTTNALVIYDVAITSPAVPSSVPGAYLYGSVDVPNNISIDPLDSAGQIYGGWLFYDSGTNGTMVLTNGNNQVAQNGGTYITFQPEDLNASAPVSGLVTIHDGSWAGDGTSLTNNNAALASIPAPNSLVNSNQAALIAQASVVAGGNYNTNSPNKNALPSLQATNAVVGFNTVQAANFTLTNGGTIGTYAPSNVNVIVGGIPVLQFSGSAGTSGHFVLGSTNNTLIPDAGNADGGEGAVGGQFNNFADTSGNHMVCWYTYGGYSNSISITGSGGSANSFTNNTIDASANCIIVLSVQSGQPNNGDHIYGSWNSWITNTSQFILGGYNEIIDGSNSFINASSVNIYNALAVGPNVTITNSDDRVISAGENAITTPNPNMIILNAPNGVGINTNASPAASVTVYGTGTNAAIAVGGGMVMYSVSAASAIPPYSGTATNWWIGVVAGTREAICTNNGAGTLTTIKL